MPFLDGRAVSQFLASSPNANQIANAYAFRCLVQRATYPSDYLADARWTQAITPSNAGSELLTRVSTQPIRRADLYLALFGLFSFQDLLVDIASTDLELVRKIIEEEALHRRFY